MCGQVLEAVALGKSLRLVRAPKPLEYLDYERPDWPRQATGRWGDMSRCDTYGVTRCVTM